MQKVPGVTGVKVSLNEGLTVLDLSPENSVTLAQLRQVIRNNGFTTHESRIIARGTVSASEFAVRGSKEQLKLTTPQQGNSADVVVTGNVNTRDLKAMTLTVSKVEPYSAAQK